MVTILYSIFRPNSHLAHVSLNSRSIFVSKQESFRLLHWGALWADHNYYGAIARECKEMLKIYKIYQIYKIFQKSILFDPLNFVRFFQFVERSKFVETLALILGQILISIDWIIMLSAKKLILFWCLNKEMNIYLDTENKQRRDSMSLFIKYRTIFYLDKSNDCNINILSESEIL